MTTFIAWFFAKLVAAATALLVYQIVRDGIARPRCHKGPPSRATRRKY